MPGTKALFSRFSEKRGEALARKATTLLPVLSYFPRRRAEESRVHTRMYRCSSLSISFRWIPNFYVGEKPEQEMRNPRRLSHRQSLSFPSELSLSRDPEDMWKPDEERLQRNRPV